MFKTKQNKVCAAQNYKFVFEATKNRKDRKTLLVKKGQNAIKNTEAVIKKICLYLLLHKLILLYNLLMFEW